MDEGWQLLATLFLAGLLCRAHVVRLLDSNTLAVTLESESSS